MEAQISRLRFLKDPSEDDSTLVYFIILLLFILMVHFFILFLILWSNFVFHSFLHQIPQLFFHFTFVESSKLTKVKRI